MRNGAEAYNEFEYGDNNGGGGYFERYYGWYVCFWLSFDAVQCKGKNQINININ